MSGAAASVAPTTSATIDPSYAAMYQQYQLAAAAAVTNSVDNSANSAATVHAQINYVSFFKEIIELTIFNLNLIKGWPSNRIQLSIF